MDYSLMQIPGFIDLLASKEPVPGGGGASALTGAIGTALGNMVGSLTVGKKKYADVEGDIIQLKQKADGLQARLLALIDRDALVFEPLARAYGLPKDTEEQKAHKQTVMEEALNTACSVPMEIMEACCEAILLHQEFAQKGSVIAISDVGVGVMLCRAALLGASLNVFINTKSMQDKEVAKTLNDKANQMLQEYVKLADEIYNGVLSRLV